MTAQILRAGMTIDIPSREEMAAELDAARARWDVQEREQVRGIKPIRRVSKPGTNTADGGAPASGYAWSLMSVTAVFSTGSDLCVFLGNVRDYAGTAGSPGTSNLALLGAGGSGSGAASETLNQVSFGFRQCILHTDEYITVVAQNGSANINILYVAAIEIPEPRLGILLA